MRVTRKGHLRHSQIAENSVAAGRDGRCIEAHPATNSVPFRVSRYGYLFTAFVGLNLLQSGFTNWCPMMTILRKLGEERREESEHAAVVLVDCISGWLRSADAVASAKDGHSHVKDREPRRVPTRRCEWTERFREGSSLEERRSLMRLHSSARAGRAFEVERRVSIDP
jgi:hypothetical protein